MRLGQMDVEEGQGGEKGRLIAEEITDRTDDQSHVGLSSTFKIEKAGPLIPADSVLLEVCQAYNNLFLLFHNLAPNIHTKNIEIALRQIERLINISMFYGCLGLVRPSLSSDLFNLASIYTKLLSGIHHAGLKYLSTLKIAQSSRWPWSILLGDGHNSHGRPAVHQTCLMTFWTLSDKNMTKSATSRRKWIKPCSLVLSTSIDSPLFSRTRRGSQLATGWSGLHPPLNSQMIT
jgi:hypothetical protein